jgi:hypothetical protein
MVSASRILADVILVLLKEGVGDVRCLKGLVWNGTCTRFHDNRFRHSGNIIYYIIYSS